MLLSLFKSKKGPAEKNLVKTSFFELKNLPELANWKIPKFEIQASGNDESGPVVF